MKRNTNSLLSATMCFAVFCHWGLPAMAEEKFLPPAPIGDINAATAMVKAPSAVPAVSPKIIPSAGDVKLPQYDTGPNVAPPGATPPIGAKIAPPSIKPPKIEVPPPEMMAPPKIVVPKPPELPKMDTFHSPEKAKVESKEKSKANSKSKPNDKDEKSDSDNKSEDKAEPAE